MFRRNKKAINNCPICGVYVCDGYQRIKQLGGYLPNDIKNHKCDSKFIERSQRMTDIVMDRDDDSVATRRRSFSERLNEGFDMMRDDYESGDDDDE